MKKIYIAGPMTGKKDLNEEAFTQTENKLIKNGWETINPHRLGSLGLDPKDPYYFPRIMRRDFEQLERCHAIYMIDGWEFSPGASCEHAYAKVRNLAIYYEVPLPRSPSYGDEDLENIDNYGGTK
jgi:hypothetical protein